MKSKMHSTERDILGALPALRRAAVRARKLAEATGTPLLILRNGKVTNINTKMKRKTRRAEIA